MHDADARDEAAHKRVVDECADRGDVVQQRIQGPEARPGNHGEEQPRLEAVEGKEEGQRHARDCNGLRKRERRPGGRRSSCQSFLMLPPSPRLPPLLPPPLRLPLSPLERPDDDEPLLLLPLERDELPLSLDGRLGRTVSREPLLPRSESPRRVLLPLPRELLPSSLRG